jgi:hypothetical protein
VLASKEAHFYFLKKHTLASCATIASLVKKRVHLFNMNGFRTETMYDYYIAMKSMFFGCKIILPPFYWLCKLHHSPTMIYTQTTPKLFKTKNLFQNQNFNSHKLCIHTIILYKWRCFSRSQTPFYILTKKKPIKKLPKTYPPHGSPK